jgi:predicted GH43/DUF377 family glycosyl hydrolase
MKKNEDIKRLIETAKKRFSSVEVNNLNNIIENNGVKKSDLTRFANKGDNQHTIIVRSLGTKISSHSLRERGNQKFLTKLNGNFHRISLPEKGAFNAAIVRYNEEKIICVYRSDEAHFVACYLDNNYNPIKDSFHNLKIKNCSDPRLIWLNDGSLFLVYSSIHNVSHEKEYISGTIIMDQKETGIFIDSQEIRISPESMSDRQKNWMPFIYDKKVYLVSSVCPHVIHSLDDDFKSKKAYQTNWSSPWFINMHHRGNTNAVMLDDGNYLATFHTSFLHKGMHYYDNGSYIFSGKPPFNVLKCSNRTYLPAESACEKHFRKESEILCNFPVGMMLENNKVIISYGDNDSVVKIVEYKVEDFLNTMVDV